MGSGGKDAAGGMSWRCGSANCRESCKSMTTDWYDVRQSKRAHFGGQTWRRSGGQAVAQQAPVRTKKKPDSVESG